MTDERAERITSRIRYRQTDLTVVLENVHHPHNIGAVLRTCDAVGIREIYLLNTIEPTMKRPVEIGKKSASNIRKWVDIHLFKDRDRCFEVVKKKYPNIWATHLDENAVSIYDVDLSLPTALLFGNEHEGVSKETLAYCNGNFSIPMFGFAQSLNISVACAVSLYEASRQRIKANKYQAETPVANETALFKEYAARAKRKHDPAYIFFEGETYRYKEDKFLEF